MSGKHKKIAADYAAQKSNKRFCKKRSLPVKNDTYTGNQPAIYPAAQVSK